MERIWVGEERDSEGKEEILFIAKKRHVINENVFEIMTE
jgi:hypothetical protein